MKKYQKLFLNSIYKKFFMYMIVVGVFIFVGVKLIEYFNTTNYVKNFFDLTNNISVITNSIETIRGSKQNILFQMLEEKEKNKESLEFTLSDIQTWYEKNGTELLKTKGLKGYSDIEHFGVLMDNIGLLQNFGVIENYDIFIAKRIFNYKVNGFEYTYDLDGKVINMFSIVDSNGNALFNNNQFTFASRTDGTHLLVKNGGNWLTLGIQTNGKNLKPNAETLAKFTNSQKNGIANIFGLYSNTSKYFVEKNAFIIKKKSSE